MFKRTLATLALTASTMASAHETPDLPLHRELLTKLSRADYGLTRLCEIEFTDQNCELAEDFNIWYQRALRNFHDELKAHLIQYHPDQVTLDNLLQHAETPQ